MLKCSCHQDVKKNCFWIVGGVCNFLASVSPQQRFEMVDQCYSSVIAESFIWQTKDSTPSRHEGRPTPKGEASICLGFLLLYICLFHTLSLPCANWCGQEVGVLVSLEALIPVCGFSFVPFSQVFPFLCLLASAVLDSFFLSCSYYLTELKHKSVQGDSETSVGLWRK